MAFWISCTSCATLVPSCLPVPEFLALWHLQASMPERAKWWAAGALPGSRADHKHCFMGQLIWPVTVRRGCHRVVVQIGASMAVQHFSPRCSEVPCNISGWAAQYSLVKDEAAIKLEPTTPLHNLVPARLLVLASNGEGAVSPAAGRSQCPQTGSKATI